MTKSGTAVQFQHCSLRRRLARRTNDTRLLGSDAVFLGEWLTKHSKHHIFSLRHIFKKKGEHDGTKHQIFIDIKKVNDLIRMMIVASSHLNDCDSPVRIFTLIICI